MKTLQQTSARTTTVSKTKLKHCLTQTLLSDMYLSILFSQCIFWYHLAPRSDNVAKVVCFQ